MFKKKEKEIPEERKQAIFLKIRPIIAKELEIDENRIELSSRVVEDLGADSLDAIEIIMALEEAFGIEILDEDAEEIKTIEDIVFYLAEKVNE
ncbi:MAG: acyl carrier protein [Candidatus Omnitrophica bacterium]|nr:acyl carrier protein [Candidatus Omnitrophota bacterium]